MEELTLTTPVTVPSTTKYKVTRMMFDLEGMAGMEPGRIEIALKDDHDRPVNASYMGQPALDFIKYINTANFTTVSLHKRVLNKLAADGKLPAGTVTGAPDPPITTFKE